MAILTSLGMESMALDSTAAIVHMDPSYFLHGTVPTWHFSRYFDNNLWPPPSESEGLIQSIRN